MSDLNRFRSKNMTLKKMVPDYVINSPYSIINRFEVFPEYQAGDIKFKYTVIKTEDIGKNINIEKCYSYGALTNIRECDFVSIDIDNIPGYVNYIKDGKMERMNNPYQSHNMLLWIIKQIFLEFKAANIIERIDVFRSSDKAKGNSIPLHIYIKLKEAIDVEPIYKNYLIAQIICGGHLTFINYNSFANIRIDVKYNEPIPPNTPISTTMTWISSKERTKIIPLLSKESNGKIYLYPEYIKWKTKIIERT